MDITYKNTKDFTAGELEELFLSVEWSSGHYPERLVVAMKNSDAVYSAWDGDKLVGLANALSDGSMTAYIHYMLVRPEYQSKGVGRELLRRMAEKYKDTLRIVLVAYEKEAAFYERCGFKKGKDSIPMFITTLWT